MKKSFQDILDNMISENEKASNYNKNSRVLILDGLNNYIRIWVMMPTTNEDGIHVGGITGFLQTLGLTIRTLKPTRVVVVFDGKDGSKKRKKLCPAYKANRGHGIRLNRVHDWADDAEEAKQMLYQLSRVINYLKHLPVTVMSLDNIEADDAIAYIAKELCPESEEVFISSSDKDFYQLVSDKIKIWNPALKKLITKETILEKYNIHPNNFLLFKAINGDPSDNLPGIKGVGTKTAVKMFPFLSDERQVDENYLLDYAQKHMGVSRIYDNVIANKQQYLLNYQLMKLTEGHITSGTANKIIEKFNTEIPKIDLYKIQKLVLDDKLWAAFPNIRSWININFSHLNHFTHIK